MIDNPNEDPQEGRGQRISRKLKALACGGS